MTAKSHGLESGGTDAYRSLGRGYGDGSSCG